MLLPFEQRILKGLKYRGLVLNERLQHTLGDLSATTAALETFRTTVRNGHRVLLPVSETAYLSLLAYYSAKADYLSLNSEEVLGIANCFADQAGLVKKPDVSENLAKDLELDDIPPY